MHDATPAPASEAQPDDAELDDDFDAELEDDDLYDQLMANTTLPEPPHPINWYLLTADEAEAEWLALNQWVDQAPPHLRPSCSGHPATLVPPSRTGVGTLGAASALDSELRSRARRFRADRVAHRFPARSRPSPLLDRHLRHPPQLRPPNPAGHLAGRNPASTHRRRTDPRPGRRLRRVRRGRCTSAARHRG